MAVGTLIFFVFLAVLAVGGAYGMITSGHPVHSALYLVLNFAATAGIYQLLGAPFIAIVQMAVYAGAIMVLFLFIIMYLNLGMAHDVLDTARRQKLVIGLAAALGVLVLLGTAMHPGEGGTSATMQPVLVGWVQDIGVLLFSRYLLPMEIASMLLLGAMIGALVIARPEMLRERRPGGAPAETEESAR
jgi:NADH-quinone oxidoreductase subunit J